MNDVPTPGSQSAEKDPGVSGKTGSRFPIPRLRRLALKELRETLRDRRTIVTLILMPLLVYPILSLVFRTFLLNSADSLRESNGPPVFRIAVDGDAPRQQLFGTVSRIGLLTEGYVPDFSRNRPPSSLGNGPAAGGPEEANPPLTGQLPTGQQNDRADGEPDPALEGYWAHQWHILEQQQPGHLEALIETGKIDAGVRLIFKNRKRFQIAQYQLVYDPEVPASAAAADYLTVVFEQLNFKLMKEILQRQRLPDYDAMEMAQETRVVSIERKKPGGGVSLASMIPLILVLMTITGAVYPAIDLTAGERERGTLETLMAAPVPRMGILFSKFIAVLTVAILTATLNILGMVATVWAFGLDSFFGHDAGLTIPMICRVFGLLVLFAAFFSAILLAVTSYARSFKEAQSYLIPIILLSLAPGLMAMTPGLSLKGILCVTPMINLLLLARDVLQQQVLVIPAMIAVITTVLYTGCAIFVAARIFGTDAVLYGSQGSWSDLYIRPAKKRPFVTASSVAFSLALLFPLNFMMIAILGRFGQDVQLRLGLMGLFTFLSFVVIPWLIAWHQRVDTTSGFGLKIPRFVFLVGAVLLGISLWPIVMSLISLWHDTYAMLAGTESSSQWHDNLVEISREQATMLRKVAPISIGFSMALIPAICEEWFFRGFLLRGLLNSMSKWKAIILSAVLFGLFHTLSGSVVALDRLIPTILIGVALAYLCYKSNSILPGIVLHILHNGIVAFLAYYQPQLSRLEWFPGEAEPIPVTWGFIALVPALLGGLLIAFSKRTPMESAP